ncbi:MAG TPA: efflux RND transporter periplasmic adaptor subunit, partial [Polyangia bacterium]|nr:efflux RND transporter periplasmic adaptor subunit [Polyangia bacterium]
MSAAIQERGASRLLAPPPAVRTFEGPPVRRSRTEIVALRNLVWTAVAVAACGAPAAKGPPGAGMPPMPVELQTVKASPVAETSDGVAVLKSRRSVRVQPQVEGHVTRILVAPGDKVEAGQRLMAIDPARQRALVSSQRAVEEANRANLDFLQSQFDRIRKLYARGAATRQDFDQAQSALRQAQANAASTAAQASAGAVELHYYNVVAPEAGMVGDIPVRVGDYVTPQTLLTTLDDNDTLEAYLQIPSEPAMKLALGTPVDILDGAGKALAQSKITFISPRVEQETQTVLATTTIDNRTGALRAGQFVHARVVWSRRTGPTVPVLAVQSRAGQPFVWVARRASSGAPLTVAPRPVELAPIQGQSYPVLHGLEPGEEI